MPKIREVLYQHAKGNSQRLISRSLNISRDTVRKYIEFAKQEGFNSLISDVELNNIAIKVAAIPNMTYTPAVKFFNTKNCSKT